MLWVSLRLHAGEPVGGAPDALKLASGLTIRFPSLTNVTARQTLDMRLAETRHQIGSVEVRCITPRANNHLLIADIANKGTATVAVEIESASQQLVLLASNQSTRLVFNRAVTNLVSSLPEADKLLAEHRQWWDAYWSRTQVQLAAEPVVERMWTASRYVLADGPPPPKTGADPLEAALRDIRHWERFRDLEFIQQRYPALRALADQWDKHLEKHKEIRGDNHCRYVVAGPPLNGIGTLAALRRFYQAMIELTCELNTVGVATDRAGAHLARWEDFLARLSDYPMSHAYGRKVFAWSEETLQPFVGAQAGVLFPVFPAEQITLGSDPRLLAVARHTLVVKPQYYIESPETFVVAARLAHHPPEILERFNHRFRATLLPDPATAELVLEAVHSLLLHSHEGFLRLFPCWHHPNARFAGVRATGAFLVSAEKRNGVCQPFTVFSEKGRPCGILNPWPGRTLTVNGIELAVENRPFGQLCLFPTDAGKTYTIAPKEPLPASQPYWNAALAKPVTASSNHQPADEKENWDAGKLTDGTRINTRAGHRGWCSALRDAPEATEWVQIDLGEPVPVHAVNLWPLDHGDAWQPPDGSMPFVSSDELDQSFDGFPVNFRIVVSADGQKWEEVVRRENHRPPVNGLKPADVTGPEAFRFEARPVRYLKLEITRLRQTRSFGKYAACLAEIEAVRADGPAPN